MELQQKIEETTPDNPDGDWDALNELSVLAPLSSFGQNARSASSTCHARCEITSDLMAVVSDTASIVSRSRKRKRECTPSPPGLKPDFTVELLVVDDVSFRHQGCVGRTPCVDRKVGYCFTSNRAGPSHTRNTVCRQTRFGREEATIEQVRFILSRCPCPYTAYFQEAWEYYCAEMAKRNKRIRRTKEEHLSKRFSRQINGVINEFCPDEPHAKGTADRPICIDD